MRGAGRAHADSVLFKLTGSSCAGKSTLARVMADRLPGVAVHDFDEDGVPANPELEWRNRTTESWVRRALAYQEHGLDLLLTGQSPLGEILAAPSAPELDGIAVCLIDVADDSRCARLAERGSVSTRHVDAYLGWAAWHRGHARDPRHMPEVIRSRSWSEMAWDRWSGWTAQDPRWQTDILDTTGKAVPDSAAELENWVLTQRVKHRAGRLTLARGWA